jgi:hypothetical protein
LIESNHRFAVDESDGGTLITHIQQFFQGRPVGTDVLVNELDSLLRKKLLLFVAGTSPGLAIDDNHFCHWF